MGTGLSKEQKLILGIVNNLMVEKRYVSSISRICEVIGEGRLIEGYCARRWYVGNNTRRKSIWRSLKRLEARGLIVSLGRGCGNEERWITSEEAKKGK